MISSKNNRWLWFIFITIAGLWLGGYTQREYNIFNGSEKAYLGDFSVYHTAGIVARSDSDRYLYSLVEVKDNSGTSSYLNPQLRHADPNSTYARHIPAGGSKMQYLYPPFFAFLMMGFSMLSLELAMVVWHVLTLFFLWLSIFLLIRSYISHLIFSFLISIGVLGVLEFSFPVQDNLTAGNVGTLILLLCTLGIYFHSKALSLSAFFLALATAIKLTPVAIISFFIVRKKWKGFWTFLFSLATLFLISLLWLGWENHIDFVFKVAPAMSNGLPIFGNQSVSTIIYAVINGNFLNGEEFIQSTVDPDMSIPSFLSKLLAVISLASILTFLHFRRKNNPEQIDISIIFLWTLVFSPISFRHAYALAIAPLIIAWLEPCTRTTSTIRLLFLSLSTFLILSILPTYAAMAIPVFPMKLFATLAMPTGAIMCMLYLLTISYQSEVSDY